MIAQIKRLKSLVCSCCGNSNVEKHHDTTFGLTVFKCQKCGIYIHASKRCCYYEIYNMPRHTKYQIVTSGDKGEDCIVCGKYATSGRSGAADNPREWGNPCKMCGALMHIDNCGGFSEEFCPECRKYQKKGEE